jgi:hypothetical protein
MSLQVLWSAQPMRDESYSERDELEEQRKGKNGPICAEKVSQRLVSLGRRGRGSQVMRLLGVASGPISLNSSAGSRKVVPIDEMFCRQGEM